MTEAGLGRLEVDSGGDQRRGVGPAKVVKCEPGARPLAGRQPAAHPPVGVVQRAALGYGKDEGVNVSPVSPRRISGGREVQLDGGTRGYAVPRRTRRP